MCPSCGVLLPEGDAAAVDPMIGTMLGGRYKIVKLLGEGGMGAVYQAEQHMGTTVRKVAIKTLHPHLSKDPKIMARFERECGTVAELEHPNTIQVYDFGKTDDGILYIVMEFVLGPNLADLLEKGGPMEPARATKIMAQICGSLEEAHGRGIIHRDLKPDNVVLTDRAGQKEWVKVLDFGIAKRSSEEDKNEQKLTQQGMVLGTPPYMSPEQFTGKPIDARSDIYSLGVMAYEMLSGRLPFDANTAWEWATQHMTVPPLAIESTPSGQRVPTKMRAAIMKALEKLPENRFSSVREFIDAFAGGSIPAPRVGTAPLHAGAAPVQTSERGKTQMGEPMPMPPYGAQAGLAPGAPMHGVTPPSGNHAFPTPLGIPQAPPRETRGGGGRGGLIAAIGVIGVLSVGALVYALVPHSSASLEVSAYDAGIAVSTTAPAVDAAHVDTAATTAPLIDLTAAPPPHFTPPAHHADAGPRTQPSGAKPPPSAPSPPPPPPPPPPAADPPDCIKARALQGRTDPPGRAAFVQSQGLCFAAGGRI